MVTKQTLSVLVWLKKGKLTKDGTAPIYVRITISGCSDEISLGEKAAPELWDGKSKRVKGKSREILLINNKIEQAVVDLKRHFLGLEAYYDFITPGMLKNVYLGLPVLSEKEKREASITLLEAADRMIESFEEKVNKKLASKGTLTILRTTKSKVESFLQYGYKKTDLPVKEMKPSFAIEFFDYLLLKDPAYISSNTAMKYIKKTRQFISYAKDRGWVKENPLKEFKCKYKQPERPFLTMIELRRIYDKKLIQRLEEVKDVFLFCCFTGYAYKDVYSLTPDHVFEGMDGKMWISKNRQKTEAKEAVPLMPVALEIVDKYKDHPYCHAHHKLLPVNSNQKYNGYLKEIADLCEISKHLTTHVARHTFATSVTLENDVPLETVSQMLGHRSVKTTQIYAKITQKKISRNMKMLEEKIFNKQGMLK